MSEPNDKQEFRVVDKRRFTSEGDTRDSGAEERKVDPVRAKEQPVVNTAAAPDSRSASAPRSQQAGPAGEKDEMDFASLIVSLATQALVMMGEIPNPEGGRAQVNLDASRQTIDILALLEEKTKGNLTPDEQKMMSEVLASLRMAYVKKIGK